MKAYFISLVIAFSFPSFAEPPQKLSDKLSAVRSRRLTIEKSLIETEKNTKTTNEQLTRLKTLQTLQRQEKQLTSKRLEELKKYLYELGGRKNDVLKRIHEEQFELKNKFSKLIPPILYRNDQFLRGEEGEAEAELKRRIYSSVINSQLRELEGLNADLADAEEIQARIEREQEQMLALLQDLNEQDNLLQFHQKLREALTEENKDERLAQLEEFRKLRGSEVEIERMIEQFQARQEHAKSQDKKKMPVLSIRARSLIWPLKGKVVGIFGPKKDIKTGLTIFRKGIDIETYATPSPVLSVLDGVVQFSGEIPGKGKLVIIEHPHDLYSIYAGLNEFTIKTGDRVKESQEIATVGSQIYFEIRSRNLAIDPLKWLQ